MDNPFEHILSELSEIKDAINKKTTEPQKPLELIDRNELAKRLGVTLPTVIRYVRRKKIPEIRIGPNCRYNWFEVITALKDCQK